MSDDERAKQLLRNLRKRNHGRLRIVRDAADVSGGAQGQTDKVPPPDDRDPREK